MSIEQMVEKFTERKGETKENLRLILETKEKSIALQAEHGDAPRISLEQHYQRIVDGAFRATLEDTRNALRSLSTYHSQYGLEMDWPYDWR